jgi:hypothetical protein
MSATQAAQALLAHDVEVYQFAKSLGAGYDPQKREKVRSFLEGYLLGTWTLTLAAAAAGVTEEQVVAALLHQEPLRFGTTVVCRDEARRLFL